MTDPTPPTPPHPKVAAKGLAGVFKGKPVWMYVAGATVLIGFAFIAWRRNQTAGEPITDDTSGVATDLVDAPKDYGPIPGGDSGGGYVFAAPTQGAFGGMDSPLPMGDVGEDPFGAGDGHGATMIFFGPSPLAPGAADAFVPSVPSPVVTGGGPPRVAAAAHAPVVSAAVAREQARKAAAYTNTHGAAPKGVVTTTPKTDTAPPGFPHKGPHGWYRNEKDKRGSYHLYQSGQKVYVK